jgi:hypothetical protein
MKRASEVPPVVDSFGVRPVTSVMALLIIATNGPGVVRNTSEFDDSQSMCQRMLLPAAFATRRSTSSRSSARLRMSLKRMLKRARASAGIRLTVLLPTSIEVNSRLDGPK